MGLPVTAVAVTAPAAATAATAAIAFAAAAAGRIRNIPYLLLGIAAWYHAWAGRGLRGATAFSCRCSSRSSTRQIAQSCPLRIRLCTMDNAWPRRSTHFRIPSWAELLLQPFPGGRQPGRDGPFRDAQRGRDLPIGIAVIVAEHDGRGLPRRQPAEVVQQIGAFHHGGRIALQLRAPDPA